MQRSWSTSTAFLGLSQADRPRQPGVPLHVVCDNYAIHKHATVNAWLTRHPASSCASPRPAARGSTSSKCFFSILIRRPSTAASSPSVADLTAVIEAYIDDWNDHPKSVTWTRTADELLTKTQTSKTKVSGLTGH